MLNSCSNQICIETKATLDITFKWKMTFVKLIVIALVIDGFDTLSVSQTLSTSNFHIYKNQYGKRLFKVQLRRIFLSDDFLIWINSVEGN